MSGNALPPRQKPEVCGKFKTCRAHRDAATPLPAVSLRKKGGVLGISEICRILRELQTQIESPRSNEGIRDNIQLSRKRQRAVAGEPNNDPSLSSPHVESAMTVSLRTFYRNVKRTNRTTNGNTAARIQSLAKN